MNVRRFPPPSSRFTNCVTLVPKQGGRRDMLSEEALAAEGIAVLRRSGSTEKRRPPVAARGGGAGTMEDQVGRKARCRAPGSRRGGCRPRGSGGVGAVHQEAGACCRPPCWGRSRERGLAAGCPRLEEPSPSARRRSVEPSTKGCPVPSHGTASESLSAGWGPSGSVSGNRGEIFFYFIFFPLSPLSYLSLLILPSPFLSPRLSLPPGTPRPLWSAPPREGGE